MNGLNYELAASILEMGQETVCKKGWSGICNILTMDTLLC